MLPPLRDETIFSKLVIGDEHAEERNNVVMLHVAKYCKLSHGLNNHNVIDCGANRDIFNSHLSEIVLERVRVVLHCHCGIAPCALINFAQTSSIDGLVGGQDYVSDEYLAW